MDFVVVRIHYHVWRAKEMCELFQYIGCQVLDSSERLAQRTDSFAVVAEVHKDKAIRNWRQRRYT